MENQAAMLTIVVPLYNTGESIDRLCSALFEAKTIYSCELILVDDGSKDSTYQRAKQIIASANIDKVKLIRHSRNFGEHAAILTAYRHSTGDHVLNLDDDLQNPISEALRLYEHSLSSQCDIVYGVFTKKRHSKSRNLGSKFATLTANLLLDLPSYQYLSSFRCVKGGIARQAASYHGPYPYVDGLLSQLTNSIDSIEVRHSERQQGQSGYSWRRLIRLWLNILTSFSVMPLRISLIISLLMLVVSIGGLAALLIEWLIAGIAVPGWTSLIAAMFFFASLQSLLFGIIGEYLGRAFMTVSGKPQSNIREIYSPPNQ